MINNAKSKDESPCFFNAQKEVSTQSSNKKPSGKDNGNIGSLQKPLSQSQIMMTKASKSIANVGCSLTVAITLLLAATRCVVFHTAPKFQYSIANV